MFTQIFFAVVMTFSTVAFAAVAAATPEAAAPVLYVYSVGSIATTTVILDGQELAKIKGNRIFGVKITPGRIGSNYAAQTRRRNRLSSTSPIRISISAWATILATSGSLAARLKGAELGTSWMPPPSARRLGRKMPKKCSQPKIPTFSTGISFSYQIGNSHGRANRYGLITGMKDYL